MGTTEHLTLEKFEAVHMAFRRPITPRQGTRGANSSIVSTNAVDKAGKLAHMALFRSLEPRVQCLRLPFFEQGYKFLAQQVDAAQFLIEGELLNLLLLHLSEF